MSMAYIFWEAIIEAYVCVKESERVSTSGGLGALPLRALLSQETQHFPCSPKGYEAKHAQKFPTPLSVLQHAAQTDLRPLWNVHLWVSESPSSRSSSLLQGLGCAVLSLHPRVVPVQNHPRVVQGNVHHVTLDHGRVQEGTCLKRLTSPYVLQRSRSLQLNVHSHSSAPSTSHESRLG